SPTIEQQPCAKSAPLNTEVAKVSIAMNRSYRTPSPSRGRRYESGKPSHTSVVVLTMLIVIPDSPGRSSEDAISTPSTPCAQPSFSNIFGLLTPSTPSFSCFGIFEVTEAEPSEEDEPSSARHERSGAEVNQTEESEEDEPFLTQFERMQEQIRDAQIAAEITRESPSGTRRSTRLATKETAKSKFTNTSWSTIVPTLKKATAIEVPEQPTSPPSSSLSNDAVVQLPPDPNPALLTLSWELQYPSGGSTHPSYRYPELDPRLLFDPCVIPMVNGIPNVFAVPALVLPMGWRHVTWSSLLPIVFDPYQQAFKLTPIGPMPLTCEEVQQGGLAKYVPGGEAHPEAGLLPDMTAYSDGSDEVYNFECVDWVLPFAEGETLDGRPTGDGDESPGKRRRSLSTTKTVVAAPLYLKSRDCPDDIVDIEDAWRWLKHHQTCPDTPFNPSSTKTWRGTKIRLSSRKIKAPIPSLMGAVFKNVVDHPKDPLASYLLRQNGREFCSFRSVATPVHVNIALLKDIKITLIELVSYFPTHYQWRKGGDRYVRAGLKAADVGNLINYTRGLGSDTAPTNSSISEHMFYTTVTAEDSTRKRARIDRGKDDEAPTYTAEDWTYTVWELTDYPLLGLNHGLKHLPEGPDAGPLTAVLKWCREEGRYDVRLSDVPELIGIAGLKTLIEPGEVGDPDKEVMGRYSKILKEDRKRVKTAGKRAAENEAGGSEKRLKAE
ncbi:hypothetical protein EK21DRAFT_10599, partial [Setomelanomma holmii]